MFQRMIIMLMLLLALTSFLAQGLQPDYGHIRKHTTRTPAFVITSMNGCLLIGHGVFLKDRPPEVQEIFADKRFELVGVDITRFYTWRTKGSLRACDGFIVGIPFCYLGFIFLLYPIVVFVMGPFRSWRRSKRGQCLNCGYDLTGNTSGVCPECGKMI